MKSDAIPYILSAYNDAGCQHDSSRIIFYRQTYSDIEPYSGELSQMLFVFDYMSEVVFTPFSSLITQFSNSMLTGDEKSYHAYLLVDLLMEMYQKCYSQTSISTGDECGGDILRLALYNHSIQSTMGSYEVLDNNLLKIPLSVGLMTDFKKLFSLTSMEVAANNINQYFGRKTVYHNLALEYRVIYYIAITFVTIANIITILLLSINRKQSIIKKAKVSYCITTVVASELYLITGIMNIITPQSVSSICYLREVFLLITFSLIFALFQSKITWFLTISGTGLKSLPFLFKTVVWMFCITMTVGGIYIGIWLIVKPPLYLYKLYYIYIL